MNIVLDVELLKLIVDSMDITSCKIMGCEYYIIGGQPLKRGTTKGYTSLSKILFSTLKPFILKEAIEEVLKGSDGFITIDELLEGVHVILREK